MYLFFLILPFLNIFFNNRTLGIKSYILSIIFMTIQFILMILIFYENTDILLT